MSLRLIFSTIFYKKKVKFPICEIHPFSFFDHFISSRLYFHNDYSSRSFISHLVNKKVEEKERKEIDLMEKLLFSFHFFIAWKNLLTKLKSSSFLFVRNDKASAMMQIFSWFWVNDNKKFEEMFFQLFLIPEEDLRGN